MKYFKLTSKNTGRVEVVDEEIKNLMSTEVSKRFYIEEMPESKKIIPDEIIKRKVNKDND